MNLEEMINHLYITESILEHMAEIATYDSPTGDGYSNAAERIGELIINLERLDNAMKQLAETTKPAEQPAQTDKGFTLPPYSFPPWQKTITTPTTRPPYVGDIPNPPYVGDIPNPPITVTYTESKLEDIEAKRPVATWSGYTIPENRT